MEFEREKVKGLAELQKGKKAMDKCKEGEKDV